MQQELHDEPDNGLWWDSYTEFLSDPLLWGLYSKEKNVILTAILTLFLHIIHINKLLAVELKLLQENKEKKNIY